MEILENKVAASGLITLDLAPFSEPAVVPFDIEPYLFRGLILKEKDFRQSLKELDYTPFMDKEIALFCSADAIVPVWAYALTTVHLMEVAAGVHWGTAAQVAENLIREGVRSAIDPAQYAGTRVVLKGCGDVTVPPVAYVTAAAILRPVVQSLMFGEPCSTVPLYKKKAVRA
jgi:hypothetical protein